MAAHEFMNYKNWLFCGNVTDEEKYAYKILQALKKNDYKVAGYHPKAQASEGVYNDLNHLPFQIEVLDLVVNPKAGLEILREAHKKGITRVMAQPGARSQEIKEYCEKHNLEYLESCVLVELRKAGLPL